MIKKQLTATLLAVAPFCALAAGSHHANHAAKNLVQTLTHGQVVVERSFAATPNLEGFVVKAKNGSDRRAIMYASKDGKYLFVGNLVNAKGQNLTQQYTQKYIQASVAKKAQATIAKQTHYFTEGKNSAPHKAYVFFDPNCSACHIFYGEIHPLITSGKLQVRWVPVAFLKPSSAGKAAKIFSGKNDKESAKFLNMDEKTFDMKKEEGSLEPLQNNKVNDKYFSMVSKNTAYFTKQGFYVTPTIVYKTKHGKATYTEGALPPGPAFDKFIKNMSNKW